MATTAALPLLLRPSLPRFPPALPPSLERRRPVLLLQSSAFIRRDSLSCSARNCKATSDRGGSFIPSAYVTGPASDAIFSESEPKFSASETPEKEEEVIGWGLLWSLLWLHRLRLGVALVALIGCATCTLSMPLFSGVLDRPC